jgi:hypothetical protein
MRHAARTDGNHSEIEQVFRKMLADHVTNASRWGDGAGDLFCSFGPYGCWVELKRDSKAKLTPAQIKFRHAHPGVWFRCESVEQAVLICRYIRRQAELLARYGGDPSAPDALRHKQEQSQ